MNKGILGRKLGMTQVFDEAGRVIPVTVVEAGPCVVVQKKTAETDGYNAIQVGFGAIKDKHVNSPQKGHFKKADVTPRKWLREFRLADVAGYDVGQEVKANLFDAGELVDVTGISKGHGFAGSIKRHNFRRGPMSHGSKYHRGPGSLGYRAAARVPKGRRLPGRYGSERVTIQALRVVRVDPDRNLLLIKGAVPGVKGSLLVIRDSVKAKKAQ